ncbi:MAG: hypothetical protein WDZ41_03810 [Candidatus Babeliales bacterium]
MKLFKIILLPMCAISTPPLLGMETEKNALVVHENSKSLWQTFNVNGINLNHSWKTVPFKLNGEKISPNEAQKISQTLNDLSITPKQTTDIGERKQEIFIDLTPLAKLLTGISLMANDGKLLETLWTENQNNFQNTFIPLICKTKVIKDAILKKCSQENNSDSNYAVYVKKPNITENNPTVSRVAFQNILEQLKQITFVSVNGKITLKTNDRTILKNNINQLTDLISALEKKINRLSQTRFDDNASDFLRNLREIIPSQSNFDKLKKNEEQLTKKNSILEKKLNNAQTLELENNSWWRKHLIYCTMSAVATGILARPLIEKAFFGFTHVCRNLWHRAIH